MSERPKCAWFGEGMVFDHVGLAISALGDAGLTGLTVTEDPTQKVSVAFADAGGVTIELIEPLDAASPVRASLQQKQVLVHLCFQVPDLERAIATGTGAGFHQLTAPVPAPAFGGRRIAWVYSRVFGLVELLEAERACRVTPTLEPAT